MKNNSQSKNNAEKTRKFVCVTPELHHRLKVEAAKRKIPLQQYVIELLENGKGKAA